MPGYSLNEDYFDWLGRQVGTVTRNPSRNHTKLLRQLHNKEFVWFVPNDDNRAEDGRDLRYEFVTVKHILRYDPAWRDAECTMLELLIGLSRRLAFDADGEPATWFWHMIEVLELEGFNDREYDDNARDTIDAAMERIIHRRYDRRGRGGLFPLRRTEQDQRKVELWYQLCAYIVEQF